MMMRFAPCAAAAFLASFLASAPQAAFSQTITCGGERLYRVGQGDSLSAIAQRAYSSFNYQVIYDANRDVLDSAAVLVVGQELLIPCLDGSGPQTRAEALGNVVQTAAGVPTPQVPSLRGGRVAVEVAALDTGSDNEVRSDARRSDAALPTDGRPIRLLTGSGHAPYTDRDAPEGGMITEMINRAIQRADGLRFYEIAWNNDWSSHTAELLPKGEHDLGFPWFRPDCSATERLSEAMRIRCTEYDFSEPLHEVLIGYVVLRSDVARSARSHDALIGRRICRPAGAFDFDLEQKGLVEPAVERIEPPTMADCVAMLDRGEVDVVTGNIVEITPEIEALDARARMTEARNLGTTETLHVIAPKSNPYGKAYLALIDDGVRKLREEGVWFEVTRRHLTEYARMMN